MSEAGAQRLSWKDVLARPAPKADLRVAYGPAPEHFADLWLPAGRGPHPVVVLVHGGCWLAQYPGVELTRHLSDALRKQGYAVWDVEYRRLGHEGAGYPGTFDDVARGTDHLRAIAARHSLDLTRVVASGHSAGGHLALWLAGRGNLPASSPLQRRDPLKIHAVVGVAAITDLEVFATAGAHACGADTVQRLVDLQKRGRPAAFTDTSPAWFAVPVRQWLVQGAEDGVVAQRLAHEYAAPKRARGETIDIIDIEGAGHFELIAPWTSAWVPLAAAFKAAFEALR